VLPAASSTVNTGCCAQEVPPVPVLEGGVVKTNWVAVPAEMAMEGLVVEFVIVPEVAFNVYVVALSSEQPEKVATPDAGATGLGVQVSVPVPLFIARVTPVE
jgi:hypothetical protein